MGPRLSSWGGGELENWSISAERNVGYGHFSSRSESPHQREAMVETDGYHLESFEGYPAQALKCRVRLLLGGQGADYWVVTATGRGVA